MIIVLQALDDPLTREIWLSSEDTGAWGRDLGLALPDLLTRLQDLLTSEMPPGTPSRCLLRLGMTNPPFMLDHVDEVAEFLRGEHVAKYLHVPVRLGGEALNGWCTRVKLWHVLHVVCFQWLDCPPAEVNHMRLIEILV